MVILCQVAPTVPSVTNNLPGALGLDALAAEVGAAEVRLTQTLYFALFTGCEMGSRDDCGNMRFGVGRDVGKKFEL